MAQYDAISNTYVLDATDIDPFVIPEEAGAATVLGDGRDNVITGNGSANSIEGGDGNDTLLANGEDSLRGGAGDDFYVLNYNDEVMELVAEGYDTVVVSNNYTLPDNVEKLQVDETSDWIWGFDLIGNDLNNMIVGSQGADDLNGGSGADILQGGLGSDHYYVDSQNDVVLEHDEQGQDVIHSSVSYTLGAYLENLFALEGFTDLILTGNAVKNAIVGNSGSNTLDGGGGIDLLAGGEGDDSEL